MWAKKELTCYFSTPVVVGKHLYMVNGAATLTNPSITLRCVEAETGKVAWEKPNVGQYHAALIRTGDEKLLMLDDNGYLTLSNPTRRGTRNWRGRRCAARRGHTRRSWAASCTCGTTRSWFVWKWAQVTTPRLV